MKKYLLLTIILSASYCFTDRPSGHSIFDESTRAAAWISLSSGIDDFGSNISHRIGLDFSLANQFEISFDVIKQLGHDRANNIENLKFNMWLGKSLAFSYLEPMGNGTNKDESIIGMKFVFSNLSWISYNSPDHADFWSIGKTWLKENGLIYDLSYHFSSQDYDDGILQLAIGKGI